jgi:hypothetical protein
MGYELKAFFIEGDDSARGLKGEGKFAPFICSLDLCKVDSELHTFIHDNSEPLSFFFYSDDGNIPFGSITKDDYYGETLRMVRGYKLIEMLELVKRLNRKSPYRRYTIFIAMIEAVLKGFENYTTVVFFGH